MAAKRLTVSSGKCASPRQERSVATTDTPDRMPVMLMPADYDRWLDRVITVDELRGMLKPYNSELMKSYEVSRVVNSVT